MVNLAAKWLFAVAAFGLIAGAGHALVEGDRAGVILLFALTVAAAAAGFAAVASARDYDELAARAGTDDEAAAEERPVDATEVPSASPWPLVTALVGGAIAVGAAVGAPLLVAAVVAGAVPLVGWVVQVWTEHPSWSPRLGARFSDRLIVPAMLPVAMFLVAAFIAVAFSRILLAASVDGAPLIGLAAAVAILAVLAVVASRPNVSSSALIGLAVVGALVVAGTGVVGAMAGEREFHHKGEDHEETVHIEAEETKFDRGKLSLPAGKPAHIEFSNHDDVLHNVAIYTAETGGAPLFNGKPILEGEVEYTVRVDRPGTYFFVCDFHPNMKGNVVVG
jgi:plastocyanin